MSAPGRLGEVANGRFVEFQIANVGFGGMTALGKGDRRQRVDFTRSGGLQCPVSGPSTLSGRSSAHSGRPSRESPMAALADLRPHSITARFAESHFG